MIEVRELTIGYGDRVLLEHLDFAVPAGQVFAILGGSGCGKSTLLRHLIGLELPMRGTIRIADAAPVRDTGPPTYGVLFQSGALFGSMTLARTSRCRSASGPRSTPPPSTPSSAPSSDWSGSRASRTTCRPSCRAA